MNRRQLEHIIRASVGITGCRNILVIGSQAILGAYPDAPESLLVSIEADVSPLEDPDKADLIDACIGELSLFHETFGYYAHGVSPEAAILPANWKKRLIRIDNPSEADGSGWCLSPLDLAVSKLMAGRPKDIDFVREMLSMHLLDTPAIANLKGELSEEQAALLARRLKTIGPFTEMQP